LIQYRWSIIHDFAGRRLTKHKLDIAVNDSFRPTLQKEYDTRKACSPPASVTNRARV